MARNKKAEIEIRETENDTENYTEVEVFESDRSIGIISELDDGNFEAIYLNGAKRKLSTLEEGVEYIIREYNLHDMK